MLTSRFARATGPGRPRDVVEVVAGEAREPGPGEVLVRVAAAALNHSENLALEGGAYAAGVRWPAPLGYEGAGTVVAAAPDAGLAEGARVCWAVAPGSAAEYVTTPAAMVVPVPDGLDLEAAARVPAAGVTARLLSQVWPLAGRTAVVWGAAGPVGRALTATLVAQGTDVVGVASGDRTSAVRALGAFAVDRTAGVDDVADRVLAHTGGRGVAAVFDPVGATTYRAGLRMLARRGVLISHGQLSGELPAIDLMDLMEKNVFVTKFGGEGALGDGGLAALTALVGDAVALAADTPAVIPSVGGRFALDQAADAYQALSESPSGKVLLIP
jgi:NADPH2:quinone reductase